MTELLQWDGNGDRRIPRSLQASQPGLQRMNEQRPHLKKLKIKEHPRLSSSLQKGIVAYVCTHTHAHIHECAHPHTYMPTHKIKFMFANRENHLYEVNK